MGIKEGDRVATLAWNGHRHFELYFAISSIGAVCHTINPRLFADQIIYIINHAKDRILFLDTTEFTTTYPVMGYESVIIEGLDTSLFFRIYSM